MSEENEKDTAIIEAREKAGKRVDPILKYLDVENTEVDKNVIREKFIDIWEYENGDNLSEEEQHMALIACFIYNAHNVMDEANIRIDKARASITSALSKWTERSRDKWIEEEKASEQPFKTFVNIFCHQKSTTFQHYSGLGVWMPILTDLHS